MDKDYDIYLVIGSLLISFLTSFLAIAFASFIVWHQKNKSQWWLIGAAFNMGLGIWAMHFVGMLALHLDTQVAFEPIRTLISALLAVAAAYIAFWTLLKSGIKNVLYQKLFGAFVLGSGVAMMHYLGMDAMQMFPPIQYDALWFIVSLVIAYGASYIGLGLFMRSANKPQHIFFSLSNLVSAIVIGGAVAGMHYAGMAAANFELNTYCTVLEEGIRFGSLAVLVVGSIVVMLMLSFALIAYEQHSELQDFEYNQLLLQHVSDQVKTRTAELERQKTMNERLLETMDAIVVVLDKEGRIEQFNFAAQYLTQYNLNEVQGKFVWDCLIPPEQIERIKEVFHNLATGNFPSQHCNDWITKKGHRVTIDWRNSALLNEAGQVMYVIGTGVDITQSLIDRQALELSAVAFETQEAMVVTDQKGIILRVNHAFEEITGYSLNEVLGKNMSLIRSGRHSEDFYKNLWQEVYSSGFWQGEIWNRRKNGEVFPEWLRITQLRGENGEVVNYIGNFSDISQRKKIERELEFFAFYDTVTELPNRRLLLDRLEQSLLHCAQGNHGLAVMFIDLDNFKHINDTFGHAFGDKLLQAFSQKIRNLLSDDITVSRFGGDEFVILFSELQETEETAIFQCEHIAQIMLDALADGLDVEDQKIHVSCSIGIVVTHDCQGSPDSVMMQADSAMYQAKAMGKNTFRFYTESIGEAMAERFKMEAALREELATGSGLYMVYQPQYNRERVIIGAEALVRWNSQAYGMISPMQFIPVAEESGLIDELGMLVVKHVLDDIVALGSLYDSSTLQHISINLSIKQLTNPNLVSQLVALFAEKQVEPKKVRFEFTESAFLDNALDPKTLFSEMSQIGFTFSLDDFGTGFSSLAYLKELPISELKIDKSFIDGIPFEESDTTICSATISMAQKLGLELVAEGVETQAQFDWLAEQGCDLMQGYLMSRPIEFKAFVALLENS